jgi:hypothetical protein
MARAVAVAAVAAVAAVTQISCGIFLEADDHDEMI